MMKLSTNLWFIKSLEFTMLEYYSDYCWLRLIKLQINYMKLAQPI